MNLENRQFRNNLTGETVKVIDSFENIAILENKTKANSNTLLNPNLYTEIFESSKIINDEEVDVGSFFKNQTAYNSLADRIKNIPIDQMGNNNDNQVNINMSNVTQPTFIPETSESIIYETSEEDEKEALVRKYGLVTDTNSINKQAEAFSKLLDEDELPVVPHISNKLLIDEEQVQRIEVVREEQIAYKAVEEDPIIRMFKGVKRNVSFNINIELTDKIPRVDFIEMMEDSYETSIIDFLANEFTQKILNDPESIRNDIKDKIKKMVYSSEWSSVDMDKLKVPVKKGTLNIKKQVSLDIEEDSNVEIPKDDKRKRTYKKKITND